MTQTKLKTEFKAVTSETTLEDGATGFYIEGWASVYEPADRYGDVIDKDAFLNSVKTYFEMNPILLYEHGQDPIIGNKPLGKVIQYQMTEVGLWIKAFIQKPVWSAMLQVYNSIKSGLVRSFSIGGVWTRSGIKIVEADLFEISVVATPAQPYAIFDIATKSFTSTKTKKTTQQVKKSSKNYALDIAFASLDYWIADAERLVKAKTSNPKVLKKAVKRLQKASEFTENLLKKTA